MINARPVELHPPQVRHLLSEGEQASGIKYLSLLPYFGRYFIHPANVEDGEVQTWRYTGQTLDEMFSQRDCDENFDCVWHNPILPIFIHCPDDFGKDRYHIFQVDLLGHDPVRLGSQTSQTGSIR
jgi:hypothetical protein